MCASHISSPRTTPEAKCVAGGSQGCLHGKPGQRRRLRCVSAEDLFVLHSLFREGLLCEVHRRCIVLGRAEVVWLQKACLYCAYLHNACRTGTTVCEGHSGAALTGREGHDSEKLICIANVCTVRVGQGLPYEGRTGVAVAGRMRCAHSARRGPALTLGGGAPAGGVHGLLPAADDGGPDLPVLALQACVPGRLPLLPSA